jgi:hypothetical protein
VIYNAIGVITILKVEFQMLSLSSKNYIVLKFECGKNKTWPVGKLYLKKKKKKTGDNCFKFIPKKLYYF